MDDIARHDPLAPQAARPVRPSRFAARFLPTFSLSFMGLVAVRVWLQCSIYGRYIATDQGALTVAANLVRVACIMVAMAVVVRRGFSQRAQTVLGGVSAVCLTLASALFLVAVELGVDVLVPACLLSGFGIVWGGGMWIVFFTRLSADESLLYTFGALALSCLAGFGLGLLPVSISLLVAMLMPAVSYAAFRQAMLVLDRRGESGGGEVHACADGPRVYDGEQRSTFARLLAGLALYNLALGFARGFPHGEALALSLPFQALHQVGAACLCVVVVAACLVRGRRLRFTVLWNVLLVLLGAGTLLLASLQPELMELGSALVAISNTFALGVMWYTVYDLARCSRVQSYVILGVVWAVHLLFREAGRAVIIVAGPSNQTPMLLALIMVALLSLSMTLLVNGAIPRTRPLFEDLWVAVGAPATMPPSAAAIDTAGAVGGNRGEGAVETGGACDERALAGDAAGERSFTRALVQASELYELTRREVDIARLLVRGYSKAAIGEKLCLSESTVRTHARNLYAKLGVHSRQQLIDLFEELEGDNR